MKQKYIEYIYVGDNVSNNCEKIQNEFNPLLVKTSADGFRLIEKSFLGIRTYTGNWYFNGEKTTIKELLLKHGKEPKCQDTVKRLLGHNYFAICKTKNNYFYPMHNDDITVKEYENKIMENANIIINYLSKEKNNEDNASNKYSISKEDDKYQLNYYYNSQMTIRTSPFNNLIELYKHLLDYLKLSEYEEFFFSKLQSDKVTLGFLLSKEESYTRKRDKNE